VPYIAIDPAFPHHLNSFDNVELNYSSGPLVHLILLRQISQPNMQLNIIILNI
jgi:hypothetical protein